MIRETRLLFMRPPVLTRWLAVLLVINVFANLALTMALLHYAKTPLPLRSHEKHLHAARSPSS